MIFGYMDDPVILRHKTMKNVVLSRIFYIIVACAAKFLL